MSKMISVATGFQYSVNIGYDLNNDDKLQNFIPTKSAIELLEDILLSTCATSNERARVLIGAYGKGKSHIVLTILSMLLKKDRSLFVKLMPKIESNPRLLQLVDNYYDSDNRILPVVITGSNTSMSQAFLLALQRTLSDNNLLDAMPETNYKAAVEVIKRWKKDYPNTYRDFKRMIDEPVKEYIARLDSFDVTAYENFESIYPLLTSGSTFNPFLGFDVVELYESVAKSLRKNGYSGLYVVYDEFSKYLEANIAEASISDTKMLQDFAEKCNRSGELQMHLMLISHKEISNYIDKLPQQKVDGWRGVSERFKHVRVSNNFSQTYEIIATVIQKNNSWKKFCKNHANDFDALYQRYEKHQVFVDSQDELNVAIEGCFPLHPISTFILPRLSERVAQNERTLFTFLSANGNSTLPEFLESYDDVKFELITPDIIYDYFEPLLKKEAYAGDIHTTYVLTSSILNQLVEGSLESKIVKTISLIYILEQFEKLKPTIEELVGVYSSSYDVDSIKNSINNLIEKEYVVYMKRSNGYLRLKKTSGIDIQQQIKDLIVSQNAAASLKDILNVSNFDNYMYPSRYNDDHEMIRYFTFEFINGDEVKSDVDWDAKSSLVKGDGVIYGILPNNDSDIKRIMKVLKGWQSKDSRYIFVLPKRYVEMETIAYEYQAVSTLKERNADDPIVFDEYEVVAEDLQEVLNAFIKSYTHPEEYASTYIYNGKICNIHRKSALTELMSEICDEVYSQTPVINNESVNRNEITNVSTNSRSKIISGLLRAELEPNLGLTGTGQEVSIMRSTLVRTGIWHEENGVPEINLSPKDKRMTYLLNTIEEFILGARESGSSNFGDLYDRLISPSYHIGLRLGLIPIYLAAVMHKYRQQVVISDKTGQIPVSSDALLQINAAPSNYSLEYLDWDPEKELYIKNLAVSFKNFIIDAERIGNSYDYVANAMKRWYMSLPKYSKESKITPNGRKIAERKVAMIRLLRQNLSGSELLFKKLPEAFEYSGVFTADVAEDITETKRFYDNILVDLRNCLINEMQDIFMIPKAKKIAKRMTLTSTMQEWIETLEPAVFEQLFPDGTNRFLELVNNMTNDEDQFVARVAKLATDLRLEDWDNNTHKFFVDTIKSYKKTAEDFHSSVVTETINDTSSYQITFADEIGQATTKRFNRVDITTRGKLLFNQITASIEAMGHSISEQEKRQILMEVLKKLC